MSGVVKQLAVGAVVGSAVGDALGAPFEFGSSGEYSRRFPAPVVGGIGEMIGGGSFGWEPGEFTDDTQMAIVQATSLLDRGGFDGGDLFSRFGVWANDASDVGNQTRAVLGSNHDWNEAAAVHFARNPNGGAGNGSLMRSTPTAVRYAGGSEDETIEAARLTSAVTHGDPAAGWGTALHHLMVRAAVRGDDPFEALAAGLDRLPPDQDRYRRMLHPDWTPGSPQVGNGSVWGCLATAVWAVRGHDSFADAVIAAIEVGGDTDTVAAVAGGLAGAMHGIQEIPSRWTTYLHGHVMTHAGRETYRSYDLQALALRLLDGHPPAMAPLDEGAGPTAIADGVHVADLSVAATVPSDWAVVSLCRVEDRFAGHPVRREFYMIDTDDNPSLGVAVADAVATVDAFRAEGHQVVIHCHHGASRTGLVARAWLMGTNDWDVATATNHVAHLWPRFSTWNSSFTRFLETWN